MYWYCLLSTVLATYGTFVGVELRRRWTASTVVPCCLLSEKVLLQSGGCVDTVLRELGQRAHNELLFPLVHRQVTLVTEETALSTM